MKIPLLVLLLIPLALISQTNIQGTVRDSNGHKALSQITIQLVKKNRIIKESKTDENGIYQFNDVIPGIYYVKLNKLEFNTVSRRVVAILSQTTFQNFRIDTNTNKITLRGKVLDSTTLSPILFGTVALKQNGSIIKGVETDIEGNYYFEDILPGVYDLEASYVGYNKSLVSNIRVYSNLMNVHNLSIKEGVLFDGSVSFGCGYHPPMIRFDEMESGATFTSNDIRNMPIPK